MGSNNYGVVITGSIHKKQLEEGIGFDWTLGYGDYNGYFMVTRHLSHTKPNYIPDLQDIEGDPEAEIIDAGGLTELIMEATADHEGIAAEGHDWIDWGNGRIGLAIEIGMTRHFVVPFDWENMTIEEWKARIDPMCVWSRPPALDPNVKSRLDDVEDL